MSLLSATPWLTAALLASWGAWRVAGWLASGGRLPMRGRRGTASGLAAAGLSLEAFYRPGASQVIEAEVRRHLQRDDNEEGDPPEPCTGLRVPGTS